MCIRMSFNSWAPATPMFCLGIFCGAHFRDHIHSPTGVITTVHQLTFQKQSRCIPIWSTCIYTESMVSLSTMKQTVLCLITHCPLASVGHEKKFKNIICTMNHFPTFQLQHSSILIIHNCNLGNGVIELHFQSSWRAWTNALIFSRGLWNGQPSVVQS